MAVKGHDICRLRRQIVEDHHFATSGLAQYRDFDTVTEAADAVGKDDVDVFDERVVSYLIIRNIVLYILDAAVIAYSHIMQSGESDSRRLAYTAREAEFFPEHTKPYMA